MATTWFYLIVSAFVVGMLLWAIYSLKSSVNDLEDDVEELKKSLMQHKNIKV